MGHKGTGDVRVVALPPLPLAPLPPAGLPAYHIASALLGRIEGVGGWETSIYMPNLSPTSTIQKCAGFPGKDFY